MIDYSEEYFEAEKDKLYNEIMSPIKEKIRVHKVKEVDKPFAYKYYFEKYLENDNDQDHFYEKEIYDNRTLIILGHLEYSILECYELYKKLYPVGINSLFISCLTEENTEKVDSINSFDVLYHVKYYGIQYAGILVYEDVNFAKNILIKNEGNLSLLKIYLDSNKNKNLITEDELNVISNNLNIYKVQRALKDSLIGRNEDLETKLLDANLTKEWENKLLDFSYLSKVIIQQVVLVEIKKELEETIKTEKIDCLERYILEGEYTPLNFGNVLYEEPNKEDWQRVQLKIFDLGIVERPVDFIVQDFESKSTKASTEEESPKGSNITPVNWEGSILDLEKLFISLDNKGWINLFGEDKTIREDYLKTLKACFNNTDNLFSKYDFDNLGEWNKIKEFTKNNYGRKYKPRIESQLTRIFWNGSAKDLANLFIELHEHGWIILYYKRKGNEKNNDRAFKMEGYLETIEQCFTESNLTTINTYLNPTFKEVEDINSDKWDYHYEKARVKNVSSPLFNKIPRCYS